MWMRRLLKLLKRKSIEQQANVVEGGWRISNDDLMTRASKQALQLRFLNDGMAAPVVIQILRRARCGRAFSMLHERPSCLQRVFF